MSDVASMLFLFTRELLLLCAVGLAISGADDLVVDLAYVVYRARRAVGTHRRVTAEAMGTTPPGWMAIIIPAWDEAGVIGSTLAGLGALRHARWRVFVGVYPNDPATLAEAHVAARADPRIEVVVTSRPGPTTKADCLNHLWRALVAHEAVHGVRFKAVVLHDAEDVVDPRELDIFDHLMPRLALIQLPVAPLPNPRSRWVAGHYLDEFAESHAKDLVVREWTGAGLPSAGVACAIERGVLGRIAADAGGVPFDPASFTEDYELGLRVARLGGRGAMVRVRDRAERLVVCREHFPGELGAAVRQKARWLLGIALAGWDRVGWGGDALGRYWLWRDRKPLFTGPLLLLSYLALVLGIVCAVLRATWPPAGALPPIAPAQSGLAWLLEVNGALLVWRLTLRGIFTAHAHGWREGVRAVPRALVANLINLLATWRALRRYAALTMRGRVLAWEKTDHRAAPAVTR